MGPVWDPCCPGLCTFFQRLVQSNRRDFAQLETLQIEGLELSTVWMHALQLGQKFEVDMWVERYMGSWRFWGSWPVVRTRAQLRAQVSPLLLDLAEIGGGIRMKAVFQPHPGPAWPPNWSVQNWPVREDRTLRWAGRRVPRMGGGHRWGPCTTNVSTGGDCPGPKCPGKSG